MITKFQELILESKKILKEYEILHTIINIQKSEKMIENSENIKLLKYIILIMLSLSLSCNLWNNRVASKLSWKEVQLC